MAYQRLMAQNIYDNPDFLAGYSQLPRQTLGLAGAPEWPSLKALLPDPQDKDVVDLGCGFGWVSRWMREHGASAVLGIDLSEKMIERARAATADEAIEYLVADLENFELPSAAYDIVFSSLTFHYIRDFTRLIAMISNALRPGGARIYH